MYIKDPLREPAHTVPAHPRYMAFVNLSDLACQLALGTQARFKFWRSFCHLLPRLLVDP